MPRVTLYNALNGLSCTVDAGTGLRAKSWLEELPRWAKECVEPAALAGIGLGRLANFPSVIDGRFMGTRPLGEAYTTPAYSGIEIFECVNNRIGQLWIDAGGAQNAFGVAALTQAVPAMDNYGVAANVSGVACVPVNSVGYPAFVLSDAEVYNLAATDGIMTIVVNGVQFPVTVGVGTATTAEQVLAAIHAANVPCRAIGIASGADAIDQIRLMTLNAGRASRIQVLTTAGSAGAVIFAAAAGGIGLGYGGPLNDVRNATAANLTASTGHADSGIAGLKAQRRILPGSVVVTGSVAGPVAFTMTDNRAGVLSNVAGTHVGTINYATGAITVTLGAAVAAATPIAASFKALWPINLHEQVRMPDAGLEVAVRLL